MRFHFAEIESPKSNCSFCKCVYNCRRPTAEPSFYIWVCPCKFCMKNFFYLSLRCCGEIIVIFYFRFLQRQMMKRKSIGFSTGLRGESTHIGVRWSTRPDRTISLCDAFEMSVNYQSVMGRALNDQYLVEFFLPESLPLLQFMWTCGVIILRNNRTSGRGKHTN